MKIRVLHIVTRLDVGGITSLLHGYYRYMDRTQVQFDFASIQTPYRQAYHSVFEEMGCRIHYLPEKLPARLRSLWKLIRDEGYDCVHSHVELPSAIYLTIARFLGVEQRFAHGHLAVENTGLKNRVLRWLLNRVVTDRLGASLVAIDSLFGASYRSRAKVVRNAIDAKDYVFDADKRQTYRESLGIGDKFVVGFVGRLTPLKNLPYLLQVFAALVERLPQAVLLIVGDGEQRQELERQAADLSFSDQQIRWLGNRSDVNHLMMAMDVLLLPSFREGLGMVLIEAQAASLMSIANSSGITTEARISPYLLSEDIAHPPARWAERIIMSCRAYERTPNRAAVQASGYELKTAAKQLLALYQRKENP